MHGLLSRKNGMNPNWSDRCRSGERVPTSFPPVLTGTRFRLRKPLIVFGVSSAGSIHMGNGVLSELPAGATIEICGPGFHAHAAQVRLDNRYYVVFLRDLESAECLVAPASASVPPAV
jgi:hypothetical protein